MSQRAPRLCASAVPLRRAIAYLALGGLAYVAALIAMLPAAWVSQALERLSARALLLRDPAGTAWAGTGRLYVRKRSGDLLELGLLRWSTSLSGIPAGRIGAGVALGNPAPSMHLEVTPMRLAIRRLDLELPAEVLASLAPALEAMGPEGTVSIRSDNLQIAADSVLGLADIEWRHVGLAPLRGIDLGTHIARLRGGGSKADIELGTISGPIRLSGRGGWTASAGLAVSGTVEHGADPSGRLVPFLRGMCSEYRDGRCAFRLQQ